MRTAFIGLALAVALSAGSSAALADGSQDKAIAAQIAQNLKESGRMRAYRVGVKFKEGTAWLIGQVASADQMDTALEIAAQTEGVDTLSTS